MIYNHELCDCSKLKFVRYVLLFISYIFLITGLFLQAKITQTIRINYETCSLISVNEGVSWNKNLNLINNRNLQNDCERCFTKAISRDAVNMFCVLDL